MRSTIVPKKLVVDMLCAPVETSKGRRERRKEKTGVVAPLAMHVNTPRHERGFYGMVGKILRTISQNLGAWSWLSSSGDVILRIDPDRG